MGKNKVLVKITPEGKYVVNIDKNIKIELMIRWKTFKNSSLMRDKFSRLVYLYLYVHKFNLHQMVSSSSIRS